MEPYNYSGNTKTSHSLGKILVLIWDDEISEYPLIFIEPSQVVHFDCVQGPVDRSFSSRPDPDDGGRSEGTTLALP